MTIVDGHFVRLARFIENSPKSCSYSRARARDSSSFAKQRSVDDQRVARVAWPNVFGDHELSSCDDTPMHRIAFAILLVAACEPAVGSGDESVRTELPAPLPTTEVAIPRPDLDGIRLTDRQYREIKFMRGLRENNSVPDLMRQAGALEGIDDTHADQVLQRVLEIDITVVPALIARAELSYRRGRVSAHHSSLAFLDRALELARSTGDVASALRVRCLTHLALGNETASLADEAHLVALAEIDPQVEPAARSLAAELARTGHPERAERLRRRFD